MMQLSKLGSVGTTGLGCATVREGSVLDIAAGSELNRNRKTKAKNRRYMSNLPLMEIIS
jgi:hypothetical protein